MFAIISLTALAGISYWTYKEASALTNKKEPILLFFEKLPSTKPTDIFQKKETKWVYEEESFHASLEYNGLDMQLSVWTKPSVHQNFTDKAIVLCIGKQLSIHFSSTFKEKKPQTVAHLIKKQDNLAIFLQRWKDICFPPLQTLQHFLSIHSEPLTPFCPTLFTILDATKKLSKKNSLDLETNHYLSHTTIQDIENLLKSYIEATDEEKKRQLGEIEKRLTSHLELLIEIERDYSSGHNEIETYKKIFDSRRHKG